MRKLIVSGILLSIWLSFGSVLVSNAQTVSEADVQFEMEAYDLAIKSYLNLLKEQPENEAAIRNLAKVYKHRNNLVNAMVWYQKLLKLNPEQGDKVKMEYGNVLRSIGLFDRAKSVFETCNEEKYANEVGQLVQSCSFGKMELGTDMSYEVWLYGKNSASADFSPSIYEGSLLIASFNNEENMISGMEAKYNDLNLLYLDKKYTERNGMTKSLYGSDLFNREGISSCNFSQDGSKVLFTRNSFKNNLRQIDGNEKHLRVFMADVDDKGDFQNEYALPFNSPESSDAFACFGDDENTIYFSSNRHGEKEDFDIYTSTFSGYEWSDPTAMQNGVNTSGNEITPFYADGALYFSSDLLQGIGGYDVFSVMLGESGWLEVENMGKGINSLSDDIYLIKDIENEEFIFASNRLGGKGDYDIYFARNLEDLTDDPLITYQAVTDPFPMAVNVSDLVEKNDVPVNWSDASEVVFKDNMMGPEDISLEGAVMVAQGEVINSSASVYFIQLASLNGTKTNLEMFRSLVEFGNVYGVMKGSSYKIRLGYFHMMQEARAVLSQVRKRGFSDAFLIEDILNVRELELLISSYSFNEQPDFQEPEAVSEYKVRLAAYSNPLYFNTEKVKDIGVIEQWSKEKWTIFILSGYSTLQEAENARIKAVNRGFTGAEIVIDEGGILSRVQSN